MKTQRTAARFAKLLSATSVAVLLLACTDGPYDLTGPAAPELAALEAPADAAFNVANDGPAGGQTIETTVFEHVVLQDVTTVVVVTGADPGFTPSVPDTDDVATIEAAVAAQLPPGTTFDVSVEKELVHTTFDVARSTSFELSEDAVLIGDLADWPAVLVAAGTLTVNHIDTLTETQHFLRTVTIHIRGLTPASAEECKNGGWMSLVDHHGRPFRNQGDCVSYVATGFRNPAAGE